MNNIIKFSGGAPQSFQPQGDVIVCPGEPVTFTCTVIDEPPLDEITLWRASGGVSCEGAVVHGITTSAICLISADEFEFFNINSVVQSDGCIRLNFTTNLAGATANMNETLIECHNGIGQATEALVGNSTLFVAGQSANISVWNSKCCMLYTLIVMYIVYCGIFASTHINLVL